MGPEAQRASGLSDDEATQIELTRAAPIPPSADDATTIRLKPGALPEPVRLLGETARPNLERHLAALIGNVTREAHDLGLGGPAITELLVTARGVLDLYVASRTVADAGPEGEAADMRTLAPGRILANTFIVRTLLATGGMGEIYRVRHRDLKTDHAMKILRSEYRNDDKFAQMFEDEARLLLCVRHEAVVACSAMLRDADGRQMILLELIEGPSLSERLRRSPLGLNELIQLIERIGGGLKALHQAGIVHQDLSPDNILLPDDDLSRAKIIDFGVARSLRPAGAGVGVDFAGKYSFAAPEQIGLHGGKIGPAADLYAFGLTLLAAARGERLPMGQTADEAVAARQRVPVLDAMPETLRPLIARMLAPDPRQRIADIDRVLAEARDAATPSHVPERNRPGQHLSSWFGRRRD
jgi:serine/threonine protein kinase